MIKADMHCHSKHSDRPEHWFFRQLGARESYIEPVDLYRRLKGRGMDYVTITDHDTIAGSLELAERFEDAFTGCEFTVAFPQDGVETHVCAYGLTESQFRSARSLRKDIRQFAAYLREQGVLAVVPHPMHNFRLKLTVDHLEQLLLLFEHFEEVSALGLPESVELQRRWLAQLTPDLMDRLARKHGIVPEFDRPWQKGRLGGSDDHGSLYLGGAWTEVETAPTWRDFLAAIQQRRSRAAGSAIGGIAFAHSVHGLAAHALTDRFADDDARWSRRVLYLARRLYGPRSASVESAAAHTFSGPADTCHGSRVPALVDAVQRVWASADPLATQSSQRAQEWSFETLNTFFNHLVGDALSDCVASLRRGHVVEGLGSLATLLPTSVLALPYVMGIKHFYDDSPFQRAAAKHFDVDDPMLERQHKWGWFTDTVTDINGVARTLQAVSALAESRQIPITAMTCQETDPQLVGRQKNFAPVYRFALPEYPMMALCVPPLLEVLRYCEAQQFTRIVISTPGPLGLAALAVAKILNLPTAAIYHTDVPTYVRVLTGDETCGSLAWAVVRLLYGNVDQVFALSDASREHLAANGIDPKRIRSFPKGTDVEQFTPARRDTAVWRRWGVNGRMKLLYVGRVSREKNLDVLADAFDVVRRTREDIELVIVGDGPYLSQLRKRWTAGDGVLFTGFVEGTDLARLYASADIFAFPSATDTYGSAVLEAQASGLPAVVSDRGGPSEVICADRTGLVARAGDAEGFATAVLRLASDDELRKRMGQAARKRAEEKRWEAAFELFWRQGTSPKG